jgi:antitoxin component YwqK of YwqJK toxin-antitoxin module
MRCRSQTLLLLVLGLAFLAPTPARAQPIVCPPDTRLQGEPPPVGREQWCEFLDVDAAVFLRHGPSIEWHPNRVKRSVGSYSRGRLDGVWKTWHEDGTPYLEATYRAGALHGRFRQREASGEVLEGMYVEGKAIGLWTTRDPNGQVLAKGGYQGGERHGEWSMAIDTEGRTLTGRYVRGKREGDFTIATADGTPVARGGFDGEDRTGEWSEFDERGKLLARGPYVEDVRSGEWTVFGADGKPSARGPYQDGARAGEWTLFLDDGGRAIGVMEGDRRVGDWRHLDSAGRLVASGPYLNDRPDGDWTFYGADGAAVARGPMRDGERHGAWTEARGDGSEIAGTYERGVRGADWQAIAGAPRLPKARASSPAARSKARSPE